MENGLNGEQFLNEMKVQPNIAVPGTSYTLAQLLDAYYKFRLDGSEPKLPAPEYREDTITTQKLRK